MKRRKFITQDEKIIYENQNIIISNIQKTTIYEIKQHTTNDILEAVVLMMRDNVQEEVWKLSINSFNKDINPEKSLYWLSGGDDDWVTHEAYTDSWHNLYQEFCNNWSNILEDIVDKSITLGNIRDSLQKQVNLCSIYNWAISKGFVK